MSAKFLTYIKTNHPFFRVWGEFVIQEIKQSLQREGIDLDYFLKIPTDKCRVKDEASALGKIVRKGYTNPLEQMTDLVGARFVVLLTDDLKVLERIIKINPAWNATKDNDYLDRIESHPELFDYQSIHFIVRAKREIADKLSVPTGIACEVQIRTLLQHAYAELTHDNIYKPTVKVPAQARRLVARSMALMESTDDLFCQTLAQLREANQPRNDIYKNLLSIYSNVIGDAFLHEDKELNLELLDTYAQFVNERAAKDINTFFIEKEYLIGRIQERADSEIFFSQPCVLFFYWVVKHYSHDAKKLWPYESLRPQLALVYSDLGFSLEGG